MRLSQKVFWVFFSITIICLILALNQFVTFYTQQRSSYAIGMINQLQSQVRHLDQLHLALFQRDKWFDRAKFERLRQESSESSLVLRETMAQMPVSLQAQLEEMDFNLKNFGRSLHELADARSSLMRLEVSVHGILHSLHSHELLSKEHGLLHDAGKIYSHEVLSEGLGDLQLQLQDSSVINHPH